MLHAAEPAIVTQTSQPRIRVPAPPPPTRIIKAEPRYVPERGLIRRLRTAQANDGIGDLAVQHRLDPETRNRLAAELIKAGAPPITSLVAETALSRLVSFDPLNVDALRPFLVLSADRALRATATAHICKTMRQAGRSIRILSDAIDTEEHLELVEAGQELGCGITRYEGSPNCLDILQKTDLACLSIIEAGFRAPLNKVSMTRLNTLIETTGAEPIMVMRPEDAPSAVMLSKIGLKRIVLVKAAEPVTLGPVFSALRHGNLNIAEILDIRENATTIKQANAKEFAALLT